jgi:phosphatidate phosphatase APP1
MANWKRVLTHMVANTEEKFDELRYRLHYAMGGPGPIKIVAYRGYGTPKRFYLKGRVLEDKRIPEAEENDRLWENLLNMYKRMNSDEVPHARVVLRYQGQEQEVQANVEGFFEAWIEPPGPLANDRLWQPVEIELLEPLSDKQREPPVTVAEVLVPPPEARFVVISDIDDTVLQTEATRLLSMARNVFLGNARTRLPFPGVSALYRALFAGASGKEMNPLLYLSSSPWNLYDLLAQFFNLQGIPVGPVLFLRDWGVTHEELLPLHHRDFKLGVIRKMLEFYDHLPFVLIGDSGQEDPEIYAEVVRENRERILAVYIRNVSRDMKRPDAVQALAKEVADAGSSLVLADDSLTIAQHAVKLGLISPLSLESIREDKRKDEAPPNIIEQLLNGEQDEKEPEDATMPDGPTIKVEASSAQAVDDKMEPEKLKETVKEVGKEESSKPPTVIVEPKNKTN